ncbi:tRNA (adenosine(37)-N6)-threonylcarbamoyltransferase complex ATPase subunit type 1 TsaE [Elongatibacter sediminis]|uniref:tRNA threonylcarbamoyladenosine biosynthesis protein TsaE n=1 Tax=Elongatibacter sediminis TaxID=3119006 RepID=A0AAW9RFN7_9GAMM
MNFAEPVRVLPDEAAVESFAAALAAVLPRPFVIYLSGDLGTGKTTFARALIRSLGYRGRVKSPTYGLLESYRLPGRTVLHLDLYRIESPAEIEYLALPDLFGDDGLLLVEWPERGEGFLPAPDLELRFDYDGAGRVVALSARTGAARDRVRALQQGFDK